MLRNLRNLSMQLQRYYYQYYGLYYCWRRGHSIANNKFGVVYERCGEI